MSALRSWSNCSVFTPDDESPSVSVMLQLQPAKFLPAGKNELPGESCFWVSSEPCGSHGVLSWAQGRNGELVSRIHYPVSLWMVATDPVFHVYYSTLWSWLHAHSNWIFPFLILFSMLCVLIFYDLKHFSHSFAYISELNFRIEGNLFSFVFN